MLLVIILAMLKSSLSFVKLVYEVLAVKSVVVILY